LYHKMPKVFHILSLAFLFWYKKYAIVPVQKETP
jgi:hypothetical protein